MRLRDRSFSRSSGDRQCAHPLHLEPGILRPFAQRRRRSLMRPLIESGRAKAITCTPEVAVSFRLAMPINLTRSFSTMRMVGTPSKLARPCARGRQLFAGARRPRRREIPPAIGRRLLNDTNDPHRAHLGKPLIDPTFVVDCECRRPTHANGDGNRHRHPPNRSSYLNRTPRSGSANRSGRLVSDRHPGTSNASLIFPVGRKWN